MSNLDITTRAIAL